MKVGDRIKDNDPRMGSNRVLTIIQVLPTRVVAKNSVGQARTYLKKHIHSDGKPRRSGFDLLPQTGERRATENAHGIASPKEVA